MPYNYEYNSLIDSISMIGVLQKRKFENAMRMDVKSWGVRRNAVLADILTINEVIVLLARTVRWVSFLFFLSTYPHFRKFTES